jgi:Zn-dependent protease/CBS domain-containing protein
MPGSILVARVLGIDIRIHFSWFLIFGLVVLSLYDRILPAVRPTWSEQKTIVVAAIAALLFFASVIAHELAHALVARRYRLPVSSITLFLLGGVANLAKEPPAARSEFLMAVAGPLTSLAIGGAGLGVAQLASAGSFRVVELDTVEVVASYLGLINLVLAAFNMIPGFPLDGGRVLRAIVWGALRDRARATRVAARGGQVVAGLLVLSGVWRAVTNDDTFGALWMGLIAYFLYSAASASIQQERMAAAVSGVRVAPLMSTQFEAVPVGSSLAEVVQEHMLPRNARAIAVVEEERFRGLVTIADLRKIDQREWATTPVERVMTPAREIPSVEPGSRLMTAIERFGAGELPVLPVVQDGVLVGMLDREAVAGYVRMREMLGVR